MNTNLGRDSFWLGASFIFSVALCGSALAQVLDQVHDPTVTGAWQIGRQDYEGAQTVTPGLTGLMTQVDVYIARENFGVVSTGGLIFDVRPVDGLGEPLDSDGSALFSAVIPESATPASGFVWVSVNLGAGLPVTAGSPFAITLRPALPLDPTNTYLWRVRGVAGADYPGGNMHDRQRPTVGPLTSWTPNSNRDAAFRTYVQIAPEPGAAMSLLTSCLVLLVRRRRKSGGS